MIIYHSGEVSAKLKTSRFPMKIGFLYPCDTHKSRSSKCILF